MPMVQLWRADEKAQRANRQAHVRMDENRPQPTKGKQSRESFQRKSHRKGRQIDQSHGVNCVERVFAMRGEPVEMFGAVVDRVEAPKKPDLMLQTMTPIDQQVAQEDDLQSLQPPGLRTHCRSK